jgi:uncharacterized protein YqgC (DUF456 family)
MRFAIIALLLISLVGCIYPLFSNASVLTIDLVIFSSVP